MHTGGETKPVCPEKVFKHVFPLQSFKLASLEPRQEQGKYNTIRA